MDIFSIIYLDIFRFRNYLSSDMAALIPFLISVRWTVTDERADALDMLQEWTPISAPLALSLLGSDGPCREVEVRRYAIDRLQARVSASQLFCSAGPF